MNIRNMADRIATRLNLTPEQRTAYDAIVAKHEAATGDGAEMRGLMEQMRAARDDNDDAKVAELREKMRQMGAAREEATESFFDEVETILSDQQKTVLDDVRDRMRDQADQGRRGQEAMELMRRLPDELNLTPEQRTQYEALIQEQRESRRAQGEELRPLFQQLREARQAGDEARAAQIEAEIEAKQPQGGGRGGPGGPGGNIDELLNKLMPILSAEQQAKLTELRQSIGTQRGGAGTDVRSLLRAARQLELNDQQKQQLRLINREATSQERAARDPQSRAAVAQTVKAKIVEILDANQAAEFERLLSKDRPARDRTRGVQPGENVQPAGQPAAGAAEGGGAPRRRNANRNTPN